MTVEGESTRNVNSKHTFTLHRYQKRASQMGLQGKESPPSLVCLLGEGCRHCLHRHCVFCRAIWCCEEHCLCGCTCLLQCDVAFGIADRNVQRFYTRQTSHRALACKTQIGLSFLPNIQEKYLEIAFCRKKNLFLTFQINLERKQRSWNFPQSRISVFLPAWLSKNISHRNLTMSIHTS